MRYMMFIKHPGDYDVSQVPQSLFAAMGEFVEEQTRKGMFIDGAGLQPLSKATRVRLSGGYSLIEAPSHAAAVELARKFMELHRVHWPEFEGESEVRPLEDMGAPPQT
jgi:hypothetical protein